MSPSESLQTTNATPALIRLVSKHAIGTLCASLLSSKVSEEFEALISATSKKEAVLQRAGSLLIGQSSDKEFIVEVAKRLAADFERTFWVEVIEQVIRNTSCKFVGLGEFKRFEFKVSLVPELLSEESGIPSIAFAGDNVPDAEVDGIVHERTRDIGLDVLCRVVMEPLRSQTKTKYRGSLELDLQLLTSDFLTSALGVIFPALTLPARDAAEVFAHVSALTSYYAWVVAFQTLMVFGIPVLVEGIGSFRFVGGATSRVDFKPTKAFGELIKSNVESDLPDEQAEPEAAA